MKPRLIFTRNGRPTGDPVDPPFRYNDVHFAFTPGTELPQVTFTKDGERVPDVEPFEAPEGANDVGVEYHRDARGKMSIRWVHWTRDGDLVGEHQAAPEGANDVHLTLGKGGAVTGYWFTIDGHRHGQEHRPPLYANDVHLVEASDVAFAPSHSDLASAPAVLSYLTKALPSRWATSILGTSALRPVLGAAAGAVAAKTPIADGETCFENVSTPMEGQHVYKTVEPNAPCPLPTPADQAAAAIDARANLATFGTTWCAAGNTGCLSNRCSHSLSNIVVTGYTNTSAVADGNKNCIVVAKITGTVSCACA